MPYSQTRQPGPAVNNRDVGACESFSCEGSNRVVCCKPGRSQTKWHHTWSPISNFPARTLSTSAYFAAADSAIVFLTYKIISAGCKPAAWLSLTTCNTSSGLMDCGSYSSANKITPRAGTRDS